MAQTRVSQKGKQGFCPNRLALSPTVQTKLVDTLFDQQASSMIVGAIGTVGVSFFCIFRGNIVWCSAWMVALLTILVARIVLIQAYRRRASTDSPLVWANRFAIGAAANALTYGLASAASVLQPDTFLQMVIVTGQGAYVTVSAVRNNAIAGSVMAQVLLSFGLLVAACVYTGNPYYIAWSVFVLLHLILILQISQFIGWKTIDLLVAEESAAQAIEALAQANDRLELLATTDALTGAVNRRGFDAALAKALAAGTKREQRSISLLLFDLDHFKALNDAFGHPAGDHCLCRLAACLRTTLRRPLDLVARFGGEEFAVLLPDTDYTGASIVADRLRIAVEALSVPHPTNPSGAMTVSVGYATSDGGIEASVLIKTADDALYRAKSAGRNRSLGERLDGRVATAKVTEGRAGLPALSIAGGWS